MGKYQQEVVVWRRLQESLCTKALYKMCVVKALQVFMHQLLQHYNRQSPACSVMPRVMCRGGILLWELSLPWRLWQGRTWSLSSTTTPGRGQPVKSLILWRCIS